MTQKKGKTVGVLSASDFAAEIGGEFEVCRSANENGKFPMYLRTKFGPITFNSVNGQNFILENARMPGAEPPKNTPDLPPVETQEIVQPKEPEKPPEPAPGIGASINSFLFGDDDE